jgi:perosamine synthetase
MNIKQKRAIDMTKKRISHSKPTIGLRELISLVPVIRSGKLGSGDKVSEFEEQVAKYIDLQYAAATSSGTTAIQLALRAMKVSSEDEIIIPSYICYSVMQAVENAGAKPVLADIDGFQPNLTKETIEKRVSKKTKAVVVPHMFGNVADIENISSLGIPVIEDCAQSIGAEFQDRTKAGSKGYMTILSFYATKMMAAARGGMILTNDQLIYDRLTDLMRYDGRNEAGECYNLSMTNLEAAIGITQLERLDQFVEQRKAIARIYEDYLADAGLDENIIIGKDGSVPFRFVYRLNDNQDISSVIGMMVEAGVRCDKPVFRPLHTYLNVQEKEFENTAYAQAHNISLPIYPSLKNSEADYVIETFVKILKNNHGG